ncbi:PREDICTED: E3 ubiquitin-protein ligase TRIM39-like [Cyprinodon variegatus]|uniref:E3 ubiquitin-protein ligase TRIM39-like n=1 Tax=Cyprinodon variegatus TaxID=28743 RepID=UPI000742C370|nr:PREDICTED: E3 ubiquitin-protein ligase TRIM39-like [Cyprinodon variegatus]
MSLQVCHCGWSKVTTYHGLRTHQGKKGCTPKGMHIPESKLFSYNPISFYQPSLIRIEEPFADFFKTHLTTGQNCEYNLFDMSLQTCHCGWSKVTTYQGLRIHQGKMGCTPKGMHIPESKLFSTPSGFNQPSLISLEEPSADIFKPPLKSVTTFTDLGSTQGMIGYTPQNKNLPDSNLNSWSNKRELSTQNNSWTFQSTPVKEEKVLMSPNITTQMTYGMTQVSEQDMSTQMIQNEEGSKQTLEKTSTSLGFTFGIQSDKSSPSDIFTTKLSSSPGISFFQTPSPPNQGSASLDKARRMLDFSSVAPKVSENKQLLKNTEEEAVIDEKEKEREAERCQTRKNMMKVQIQQKIQSRERKMIEVKSAAKGCKGSLDAEWLQINSVFTEVSRAVEAARQKALEPLEKRKEKVKREAEHLLQTLQGQIDSLRKSMDELDRNPSTQTSQPPALTDLKDLKNLDLDTSFSFGTLRATTSSLMKEIQWHLENLSRLELKRIASFAVDVKLDSATAHQSLVLSNDGKKVRDGGEKIKGPDSPGRFDIFGSVLGKNSFNCGRSYWEVDVKNKTGWDLGVARRSANRKGIIDVNTDNGYWVAVHFEDRKYAALTVPPTSLPMEEKPQKVGVFIDYEEGVVSFYDVINELHIFSFTECLFRDDICPYFSPHLKKDDKNSDPLIISAV